MKSIYEGASRVVVWLGEEQDDSDLAMEQLSKCLKLANAHEYRIYQQGVNQNHLTSHALSMFLISSEPRSVQAWKAIKRLLSRPWFSRAWIVQEATAIDQDHTDIVCGTKSVTREIFGLLRDVLFAIAAQGAPAGFDFMQESTSVALDRLLTIFSFSMARERLPGGRPLLQLITWIRPLQVTDEKDKIFCMLSFSCDLRSHSKAVQFRANYDRSYTPEHVWCAFALWHFQRHQNLDLLGHCLQRQSGVRDALPSWVPDWSKPPSVLPLPTLADPDVETSATVFNATGRSVRGLDIQQPSPPTPRFLRVCGLRLASVDCKMIASLAGTTTDDYISGRIWESYSKSDFWTPKDVSLSEYIARTLVADCRRIFRGDGWVSERIWTSDSVHQIMHWNFNSYQLRRTIQGRTLFRTRMPRSAPAGSDHTALIGLGPETMQPGDEVWLLKGGRVLYILRPAFIEEHSPSIFEGTINLTGSEPSRDKIGSYRFVGECFVHGLMDGEVAGMLGDSPVSPKPLPLHGMDESFRVVALV